MIGRTRRGRTLVFGLLFVGVALLGRSSLTGDGNPASTLGDGKPSRPVLGYGANGSSDQQLVDALMAGVFALASEVVAFGPDVPEQAGIARVDRLVVGDLCGAVGLSVSVRSGVLSIVSGSVPSCKTGSVRGVLVNGAKMSIDGAGRLTIATSGSLVVLSKSPGFGFTPTLVQSYRAKGRTNAVSTSIRVGSGALRSLDGSDGCNGVTTAIAFSSNRFVIDPVRMETMMACENAEATAFRAMIDNTTNTGTYVRRGSTLTLTFADNAVAVMKVG